jgi:uncharacterized repeat protein (TIGR01451 family)
MQPVPDRAQTGRRGLALVVAVGALLLLMMVTTLTAQAYVTKMGHDTLEDFVDGEFHRTGLLDIPKEGIQSVQLIPAGLFGDWKPGRSLPMALTELSAVAAGGQVVVMGGNAGTSNWRSEVYISTIGADGTLGNWRTQTAHPLPHAVAGAAAAVQPKDQNSSWIYLLGGTGKLPGESFPRVFADVYVTTLDHNSGTIGPWISTEPLSTPVKYAGAAAINGYLYLVGGNNPLYPYYGAIENVYFARIKDDGTLEAWHETASLPEELDELLVVGYSEAGVNSLYALGGQENPIASSNDVYYANVNADGSLSPWGPLAAGGWSFGDLPVPVYAHSGVLFRDQILVTGGKDASNSELDIVKAALVDPTEPNFRLYDWCEGVQPPYCTIGAWETGPLLKEGRAFHVTVADKNYVYTLGGVGEDGNATASVYWGSVDDPGTRYAPSGYYIGPAFDLGGGRSVLDLQWDATLGFPGQMTLDLSYRTRAQGAKKWGAWSSAISSSDGLNSHPFDPALENIRYFQYRVDLTTEISRSSPLLNEVEVYFDVDDPEVSVHKDTGGVITANVGSPLQYTIYYTNSGEWKAQHVVLTETLPAHTTYIGGSSWHRVGSSNVYTYQVGDLLPQVPQQTSFRVRVDDEVPQSVKSIKNQVDIGFPPLLDALGNTVVDPEPENNHAKFSNPVSRYALAVAKSADPASGSQVLPGGQIQYTLSYENTGQEPISALVLKDDLPAEVTYVAGSIRPKAQGDDTDPEALQWTIGDLDPGESGTAQFSVKVKDNTPDGTVIQNRFTADGKEISPKTSSPVQHTVGDLPQFTLVLTKTAAPDDGSTVHPGDEIAYSLTYLNDGSATLTDLELADTLPDHVHYVAGTIWPKAQGDDANPGTLSWTVDDLAPGASGTVGFVVTVDLDASAGTVIANSFTADTSQTAAEESNAVEHTVVQVGDVALSLSKTSSPANHAKVHPGDQIAYTLTYRNNGSTSLTSLQLTDALPAYVTYVAGSIWPPAQGNAAHPTKLKWVIGDLAPGASGSAGFAVTVDGDAPDGTVLANSFTARSDQTGSTASPLVMHTVEAPVLVLAKAATPAGGSLVSPGDVIDYTLTYRNTGDEPLTNLTLDDLLPDAVTYVADSIQPADKGDDSVPTELKWTIGNLDPGASGTASFSVKVKDGLPGSVLFENHFTGETTQTGPIESNKVWHETYIDAPDFVITSMVAEPQDPAAGQPFNLIVTVKNQGTQPAEDGAFWVEAYIRPHPSSWPANAADHYMGYCPDEACTQTPNPANVEWRDSLGTGESFHFLFQNLVLPSGGIVDLYSQVDVCFEGHCRDPRWGWYLEQNESNNVARMVMHGSIAYLPAITRIR